MKDKKEDDILIQVEHLDSNEERIIRQESSNKNYDLDLSIFKQNKIELENLDLDDVDRNEKKTKEKENDQWNDEKKSLIEHSKQSDSYIDVFQEDEPKNNSDTIEKYKNIII
jgi:hypothetical protein